MCFSNGLFNLGTYTYIQYVVLFKVKSSEAEVLGLKRQVGVLEGLLEEGRREVSSLQESLASQDTLRKDVRTKLQVVSRVSASALL